MQRLAVLAAEVYRNNCCPRSAKVAFCILQQEHCSILLLILTVLAFQKPGLTRSPWPSRIVSQNLVHAAEIVTGVAACDKSWARVPARYC